LGDLLSQDEIDSLISAVGRGRVGGDAETAGGAKNVKKHDFRKPARAKREQMQALHVIHEDYARSLSAELSALLRKEVGMKLVAADEVAYGEFVSRLPKRTCLSILEVAGIEQPAVLEINPVVAFAIIESLLGGGTHPAEIDRALTDIEISILQKAVKVIAEELGKAWKSVKEFGFKPVRSETNAELVRMTAPEDAVVYVTFEGTMGEVTGTMSLCYPFDVVEAIPAGPPAGHEAGAGPADETARKNIRRNLLAADVSLSACLGKVALTMRELLDLKAGDVVRLPTGLDAGVVVSVERRPKFRGKAGLVGRARAVLITEHLLSQTPTAGSEEAALVEEKPNG